MSGPQRAQSSSTSLLSESIPRGLVCENTYHHPRVVSILLKNYACELRDSTGMRGAASEDLLFPAARSIDGEALASELVGEEKGCGHLRFRCCGWQIDGF